MGGAENDRTGSPAPPGRRKIAFVINSIGSGGAERVLDLLLRAAPPGWACHLVLLDDEPERRALPPLAGKTCLDARGSLVRGVVGLRRTLRALDPDLVVSLLVRSNMAAILAGRGARWPTIVCERMHLGSHLAGRYTGLGLWLRTWLPRRLLPRADLVLAVSSGVADDLRANFSVPAARLGTINNPYDLDGIAAQARAVPEIGLPPAFLVAVGRLVAAKGFAELVAAYAVADPPLPLLILGEGPEQAALQARIDAAGLDDRVRLLGFTANPFAILARGAGFVSASRNEGFPNAMAEAMALGVPVLATDCPSGPARLLDGRAAGAGAVVATGHGLLVPMDDHAALVRGLRQLTDPADAAARTARATAARERMTRFSLDRVAGTYWRSFATVAGGGDIPALVEQLHEQGVVI
jgi:glycosyltransferase involved in cell wall biosynthesis